MFTSMYEPMPPVNTSFSSRSRRNALTTRHSGRIAGCSSLSRSIAGMASRPFLVPMVRSTLRPRASTIFTIGMLAPGMTIALRTAPPTLRWPAIRVSACTTRFLSSGSYRVPAALICGSGRSMLRSTRSMSESGSCSPVACEP